MFILSKLLGSLQTCPYDSHRSKRLQDYRITPKICAPVVLEGREFYLIEHKDTKAQSLLFLSL